MTFSEFASSLAEPGPPAGIRKTLLALWHDAKGAWQTAHAIVQSVDGAEAAWVHAYLHRKEGDTSNASYWYSRAGKPFSRASLEGEWADITASLLGRNDAG